VKSVLQLKRIKSHINSTCGFYTMVCYFQ